MLRDARDTMNISGTQKDEKKNAKKQLQIFLKQGPRIFPLPQDAGEILKRAGKEKGKGEG